MGDVKNLHNSEGIEKVKEMATSIGMCMFCTSLDDKPFKTRPMSTQDVDYDGNIWFFSSKSSNKDKEIRQDDKVQLIYSDNGSAAYMTIYGTADVIDDRKKVEELWSPIAKAWFKDGKEDADLELIRVRTEDAYYWDTKHSKMVSFLKILAATISGKTMDDGIEGKVTV